MRRRPLAPRLLALAAIVVSALAVGASSAAAQVIVSPNAEPERNDGGWIYWIAIALVALGVIVAAGIVFRYMRYAPRFQREEGGLRTVKAPRIQPGREAPRRPVNITGAPVVVPAPAAAAPVAAVAAAPAPALAPAAPAPAAAAPPAPAPAAAEPAAPAPAATPSPAPAAPAEAPAPAGTAATESAAAPAPAPAPSGERKEVALDQETFDRVLAELLEKGTARRVAEGQARRAAMIAARKKAGA